MLTGSELSTIVQLLEIVTMVSGVGVMLYKLGRAVTSFELIGSQQAKEIGEMKTEIKGLNVLLTTVAVQKAELINMHEDITLLRRSHEELRRGRDAIAIE